MATSGRGAEQGTRNPSSSRLVLCFDAGCGTCSDIAGRVEARIGNRIEVRNLRDPEIQALRERALANDARWAPTLLRIRGDRVEGWTGWRMGWALSRSIGAAATWRVLQALGEAGASPSPGETAADELPGPAADAVAGVSRGRFLTGLGGAAVAMSVMSGTDLLASPAIAARRKRPYDVVDSLRIRGEQLQRIAREAGSAVDVRNMVGDALSTTGKVEAARPVAFEHKFRNKSRQRVIIYHVAEDRKLAYVVYTDPPKDRAPTRSMVWRKDGRRWVLAKGGEGGQLWRRASDSRSSVQNMSSAPLDECPPIGNAPGHCYVRQPGCTVWSGSGTCWGGALGLSLSCGICIAALGKGSDRESIAGACGGCAALMLGKPDCCVEEGYVWVNTHGPGCG